jgi:hypothetical protein
MPGMAGGSAGFSIKAVMRLSLSTAMTPKPEASVRGTSRQATVTSASWIQVLAQHHFIVHLVDMVAGKNDHIFRTIGLDDVDILKHRIGGAFIPLVSETRWEAGRISKLSFRSGRKKFQPCCKCRMREWALYWVATPMRRMPGIHALESAKSMMRALPPK